MRKLLLALVLASLVAPLATAASEDGESLCPMGFGAGLDDAKDADGKKWGVLVQQVIPGGRAFEMGLQPGDVIVAVNGESVLEEGAEPEDPYNVLVRLLTGLECGKTATLAYVRDGSTRQGRFLVPQAR